MTREITLRVMNPKQIGGTQDVHKVVPEGTSLAPWSSLGTPSAPSAAPPAGARLPTSGST